VNGNCLIAVCNPCYTESQHTVACKIGLGDERLNDSNATITDHWCNITAVGSVPIADCQAYTKLRIYNDPQPNSIRALE